MREHRVIEGVLGALESLADSAAREEKVDREIVAEFARFFREFADRCHHGKEEKQLFVVLADVGLSPEQGPIAVMMAEHEEGREHVRALAALGAGDGPLSRKERDDLIIHASGFAVMLRDHIHKEDTVLFPMAESRLGAQALADLAEGFRAFEQDVMGAGKHEQLHGLADRLLAAYPPHEGAQNISECLHQPAP
jgi:hemerythrin-like domain-containing protein